MLYTTLDESRAKPWRLRVRTLLLALLRHFSSHLHEPHLLPLIPTWRQHFQSLGRGDQASVAAAMSFCTASNQSDRSDSVQGGGSARGMHESPDCTQYGAVRVTLVSKSMRLPLKASMPGWAAVKKVELAPWSGYCGHGVKSSCGLHWSAYLDGSSRKKPGLTVNEVTVGTRLAYSTAYCVRTYLEKEYQ
eukprot:m.378780 g.378780  ORF g.378780 m.378780 type:complete len:190 (-) comp16708_c4_seq3:808-1377(-)